MNAPKDPALKLADDGGDTEDVFSLGHVLSVLSAYRVLVATVFVSVVLVGTVYLYTRTPIYEASVNLLIVDQKSGGLSGLEQLSTLIQGTSLPTATEVELLKTRATMLPVVEKYRLNLATSYHRVSWFSRWFGPRGAPKVRIGIFDVPTALEGVRFLVVPESGSTYTLYGPDGAKLLTGEAGKIEEARVATGEGFGIVRIRIESLGGDRSPVDVGVSPPAGAADGLVGRMDVSEVGLHTGIVRAALKDPSPRRAAELINAIAEENVRQNNNRSAIQASSQLSFLTAQLPKIEQRVKQASGNLSTFLSTHPTLALSQDASFLMNRATDLQGKIAPLQAQLAEARTTLGPSNPQLQTLQTQLSVLQGQYNQLLSTASKLPQEQQQLVQLQSSASLAQNLYQAVLGQLQTLQIAQAGSVGDVVIIDPATVPRVAVLPRYGRGAIVTILLGLILSVGAAFGMRALRKGIEDPEVLDGALGLPVYAVIPHSSRQQQLLKKGPQPPSGSPLLLSALEASDAAVEGLRSLRTAIQVVLPRSGPRIICVSSLGPGEGKSFISGNLAFLFAQSGVNVLLIDADMRRGHINKLFRHPRARGLSELLEGVYSFEEVVRQTPVEHLHFISTGELPDDAANVLANADLDTVIGEASSRYDLVIVDVPPVLAVSDAYLVTRHASLNLLLLKYGLHSERQVRLVKRQFERHGIRLHGSILNDVSAASQRYAYYKYGYTYQYDYKGNR